MRRAGESYGAGVLSLVRGRDGVRARVRVRVRVRVRARVRVRVRVRARGECGAWRSRSGVASGPVSP